MPFIHPDAIVLGDVFLGRDTSVWPAAVIRGDTEKISVGDESNVQDGSVIHADPGFPCIIGARVTVGHRAVVHGATVEDECLIGMGSIVMNGAYIGTGSVIGAGAVIPEGMKVPPHSLVLGIPGKIIRQVDDETRARVARGVRVYVELQARHRDGSIKKKTNDES